MSNLKKQVAAIKQQLATETAATVARFKKVETDVSEGFRDVTKRIEALEKTVATGFVELRMATEAQANAQQQALDQLLDLVVEHTETQAAATDQRLQEVEARLTRLERSSPAA